MSNFDDLAMAVASYGGNNKVIFDDRGKPSIMVNVPKMKFSDVIAGGTDETMPWWKIDGAEKKIWVSKFINCVVNDRAYSLPMKDPKCYVNMDSALQYCRNKGPGWGLTPGGIFAALVMWSEKNGTIPRGNTNWDASYEKAWERGTNTYIDGSHDGGRTATGSGPVTWNHDHSPAGIADLCGDTWEWGCDQRVVDGEIQIIPYANAMKLDCSVKANSTEWKAIMPDGTLVEPGTPGTLHYNKVGGALVADVKTDSGFTDGYVQFRQMKAASGVNIPQVLKAAGLFPNDGMTSPGGFWINFAGERLPLRGSGFSNTGNGGPAALYLSSPRTNSGHYISFRSAFYE